MLKPNLHTALLMIGLAFSPSLFALPDLGTGERMNAITGKTIQSNVAQFEGGVAVDNAEEQAAVSITSDNHIDVSAVIHVDPADVGKSGEALAFILFSEIESFDNIAFILRNGVWLPWTGEITSLPPMDTPSVLAETINVPVYQGPPPNIPGNYEVVTGYRLDNNELILHANRPIRFSVVTMNAAPANTNFNPLATALESVGRTVNLEAVVPSQCYTKTEGVANPCWTCHTIGKHPNYLIDKELQEEYAFSDFALLNRWSNLFVDRNVVMDKISDEAVLNYIREDNYTPLYQDLQNRTEYVGWRPDLDFNKGFDQEGFAADGSNWRAIRYKPFLGTFWPTNGNTDDVMIRLPPKFRTSRELYKINLAILEAAITCSPTARNKSECQREVEPVNETLAGIDLNGDGSVGGIVTQINGLPDNYAGSAANEKVHRYLYPQDTEFFHTVRYVDPDAPDLISTRMKEVRYSKKTLFLDQWALVFNYEREHEDKDNGILPVFTGSPVVGLKNDFGWQLQAFIEDQYGRLRLQTEEEHRFCMGCHSAVGVTVDQTFTLARKVPGADGWRYQDLRGIPDVPQAKHDKPEILTYFERVTGGDEFRANDEILARFFPNGELDEAAVRRAAPGGDQDMTFLVTPSRERAINLNRAYMALVRTQTFDQGRDTIISPPENVHPFIENGATDLGEAGKIFSDGNIWLNWEGAFQRPAPETLNSSVGGQ